MRKNNNTSLDYGLTPAYLGTTRKLDSTVGSLYTFSYRSLTATDSSPLILNVRRGGRKIFKAKNGLRYMAGITLNGVSPTIRALLIRNFAQNSHITYKQLSNVKKVSPTLLYRVYDIRKVRNLHVVSTDIYSNELN